MSGVPGEDWYIVYLRCGKSKGKVFKFLSDLCETYQQHGITNPAEFAYMWMQFLEKVGSLIVADQRSSDILIGILFDYYRSTLYLNIISDRNIRYRIPVIVSTWEELVQLELALFRRITIVKELVDKKDAIRMIRSLRDKSSVREILMTINQLLRQDWGTRVKDALKKFFTPNQPIYRIAIQHHIDNMTFRFIVSKWKQGRGDSLYIRNVQASDNEYGFRMMRTSGILNILLQLHHKTIEAIPDMHTVFGSYNVPKTVCDHVFRLFEELKEEYDGRNVPASVFKDFYRNIETLCLVNMSGDPQQNTESLFISFSYISPIRSMSCVVSIKTEDSIREYSFVLSGPVKEMEKQIFHTETQTFHTKDDVLMESLIDLTKKPEYIVMGSDDLRNLLRKFVPAKFTEKREHDSKNFVEISSQPHKESCHVRLIVGMIDHNSKMMIYLDKTFVVSDNLALCQKSLRNFLQKQQQKQIQQQPPPQQSLLSLRSTKKESKKRHSKKKSSVSRGKTKKRSTTLKQQEQTKRSLAIPLQEVVRDDWTSSSQQQIQRKSLQHLKIKVQQSLTHPESAVVRLSDMKTVLGENITEHIHKEIMKKHIAQKLLRKAYKENASRIIVVDGPNLTHKDHPVFREREAFIASPEFARYLQNTYGDNGKNIFFIVSQMNIVKDTDERVFFGREWTDGKDTFFYSKVACFDETQHRNCHQLNMKNECDDYVRYDTLMRIRKMIRKVRSNVVSNLQRNSQFIQQVQRLRKNIYRHLRSSQMPQQTMKAIRQQEYFLKNPTVIDATHDKGRNWLQASKQ